MWRIVNEQIKKRNTKTNKTLHLNETIRKLPLLPT